MNEDREERVINLLLMDAGRNHKKPYKKRGRTVRYLTRAWDFVVFKVICVFWWVAYHTWQKKLVTKGKTRWQLMAGINQQKSFIHTPEKIGVVEYPMDLRMKLFYAEQDRLKAEVLKRKLHPKPDVE